MSRFCAHILLVTPWWCGLALRKHLENVENIGITHFLRVFVIKLQFSACDSSRLSVEDPSPAALRRGWGGRDGRKAVWF
ncbi:hypothetical protein, partial [Donghicola tyrosinivorans]|uniref:hypothetical protein n=1 Tax=Donghicola tyrosinivorans TaxID=1652492 RepID=UPI001B807270